VFFEWERSGEDYTVRMDARSENHSPSVTISRMTVETRDFPVYTFERSAAWDEWTVARSALGNGGGRWLPVRRPPDYLAEVFQTLARERGVALGTPVISESAPPDARVIVEHASPPLEDILRGMMRWSTNLTAEVVGLSATQAGGSVPRRLPKAGTQWRCGCATGWARGRRGSWTIRGSAWTAGSGRMT
jgi:serine-type D-Ala-D-Ala carboxypeptidase/endopeptidase (penicillin-binding protein 4)